MPFTFDVIIVPVADKPFIDITEEVAITPLIFVVKVFPDRV